MSSDLHARIEWAAREQNWRTFRGYYVCCDEQSHAWSVASPRLRWERVASVKRAYWQVRQSAYSTFTTIPVYAIKRYVPEFDGPAHGPDREQFDAFREYGRLARGSR